MHYWPYENPQWYAKELLHSPLVTVWVGIGQSGVVGSLFFTEIINTHRYLAMLQNQILPGLNQFPNSGYLVFMQDGGSPDWKRPVRDFIDHHLLMS